MQKNKTRKFNIRHRLPLMVILCLIVLYASAQSYLEQEMRNNLMALHAPSLADTTKQNATSPNKTKPGERKLIKIIYSSLWKKTANQDVDMLIDSVQFLHEGAYLFCDSAYFNKTKNTFEAFNNVRMEQGDTLFLYGNYMFYDGATQIAHVRENVKMDHRSGTLFTDSLNYDRLANIGYYFNGGMLVDSLNELTSFYGQYEPNKSLATFSDEVVLNNPNFKLFSDTLLYSTQTRIATIVSPSTIESDSGTIISSRGWYNTLTERSLLLDQSTIINKEGNQYLKGDSILYYKADNSGQVFGNMFLQDTIKKLILQGHYGFFDGQTEYAYATDSASAIEYSQGDSLYLHGDKLEMIKLPPTEVLTITNRVDTLKTFDIDSLAVDSIVLKSDTLREMKGQHELKAYYGVRFYRSDMQGVCDSIQFNSSDSVLHMYKDPVLWSEEQQLTGDTIRMYMNDSTINHIYVTGYAFAIQEKDSIHFNQLKSRVLQSFFKEGQLHRVFAEGNVETVVYPEEKDGTLNMLHNKLTSSYLEIFFKEGQFDKLKAWPSPVGRTTPFHLLKSEDQQLSDFYWLDYLRPVDKDDIFREVKKRTHDKRIQRAAVFDRREE